MEESQKSTLYNSNDSIPALNVFEMGTLQNDQAEKENGDTKYKEIIFSLNKFSSKLYSQLHTQPKKKDRNIVFSPICIHLMLLLIMLGAHGNTKTEMLRVSFP